MPLDNLVEYFNDRFELQHRSSYRPFLIDKGTVSGVFGPIRIDSIFTPFRKTTEPTAIVGYSAQIEVSTRKIQQLYPNEIENLLANKISEVTDFESFINFDRLSRTVHILNYLTSASENNLLFLEVDPRHILGIKKDHGAYFEDVISRCGLETRFVIITVTVHYQYALYYEYLINGLENYRKRGYQVALKFENISQERQALNLIATLSPDYVSLSARCLEKGVQPIILNQFKTWAASVGSLSILQQIDDKNSDNLARRIGFDIVEGSHYSSIPYNYLGQSTS